MLSHTDHLYARHATVPTCAYELVATAGAEKQVLASDCLLIYYLIYGSELYWPAM